MKEVITLAMIIATATGLTLVHVQKSIHPERRQDDAAPTAISGIPDDPRLGDESGFGPYRAGSVGVDAGLVVAIIDTGCDVLHPDLRQRIWRNPGETGLDEYGMSRATNGLDDDDNGLVDDFQGWNFANNSPDITDDHGHGTHIAGLVGSVAGGVSLMILKYYDTQNSGVDNLTGTVRAIRYAVRMGAKVINYSGGGVLKSAEEEAALAWAAKQGVLVVAAAGNEGLNSDFHHFYPADYDLPNILSVGATDHADRWLSLSNYGAHTVDVAAPGKNLYSTLPNGQHGFLTGTSQATALASGLAARLITSDPRFDEPSAVIKHLIESSRKVTELTHRVRGGGVLSPERALERPIKRSLAEARPSDL